MKKPLRNKYESQMMNIFFGLVIFVQNILFFFFSEDVMNQN